jgi:regulator of extracellular matrix RemA (YlzA/DUF370 family)
VIVFGCMKRLANSRRGERSGDEGLLEDRNGVEHRHPSLRGVVAVNPARIILSAITPETCLK